MTTQTQTYREPSMRAPSVRAKSIKNPSIRAPSTRNAVGGYENDNSGLANQVDGMAINDRKGSFAPSTNENRKSYAPSVGERRSIAPTGVTAGSHYSDELPNGHGEEAMGEYGQQGHYAQQGHGEFAQHGLGEYDQQGQGAYAQQGQGEYAQQGHGEYTQQGHGEFGNQAQGEYGHQELGVYDNQGQGEYRDAPQREYVNQGQEEYHDHPQGEYGANEHQYAQQGDANMEHLPLPIAADIQALDQGEPLQGETRNLNNHEGQEGTDYASSRPTIEPSRSYLTGAAPVVTTYEPDLSQQNRRRSVVSNKAPSVKAATIQRPPSRSETVRTEVQPPTIRAPSRAGTRPPSVTGNRPPSVAGSNRRGLEGAAAGVAGGAAVGEVLSPARQRSMQGTQGVPGQGAQGQVMQGQGAQAPGVRSPSRNSLRDSAPLPRDRSTQFSDDANRPRSVSPRPSSPFGARPQPNLMTVAEDGRESRFDGRNSQNGGVLGRSGTVVSRANTMGRNGTLSRANNGGTVGGRRGAFGRGAGATIGTQPEEVLGRDDIHTRAELSERVLDEATLRRLSTMEKKDAQRLTKVIMSEGKAEAEGVKGSIKELERLAKLQRESAGNERKSQLRLSKWTGKEHKARLRFLKEKERYERIEGELRNAENDYEERRDHAAGLTAQVAEKTQELDDLRGQKAADDREREVKLLALRNPAHS